MYHHRRFLLACLTLVTVLAVPYSPRAADPKADVKPAGALDLIPEDAALAVAVRNIAELRDRGDKLAKDGGLDIDGPGAPSRLFAELFKFLGLEKGVNEKGPAAVVVPNIKRLGIDRKELDLDLLDQLAPNVVFIVPIDRLEDVAANFKLKADDLKPSQIKTVKRERREGWGAVWEKMVVAVRDKHLYVSHQEKAIKVVFESTPVSGALSPAQRGALAKSDLSVLVGPRAWSEIGSHLLKGLQEELRRGSDRDDTQVIDQFFAALGSVRFLLVSLNIEDGLGLNLVATFPPGKDGDNATKFLAALRAGAGHSDLNGLPKVNPLIAYAAKGDGTRNVHMARALLKMVLDRWLGIKVVLPEEDRQKLLTAFDRMYQHLRGSRAVIYHTPEKAADKIGTTAALLVLDVDDPDKHLEQWGSLVDVANVLALKLLKDNREGVPKFSYKARAETIDRVRVDWLTVEIPKLPADVEREYRTLLGPDWNKLRLAVQGKQVVLLIGSDVDRLKETLGHLQSGAKGLAEHKPVTDALSRLMAERKLEFHLSFQNVQALGDGKRPKDAALTSFALGVELEHLQLEIRSPSSEVKALFRLLGMARD